MLLKDNTTTLGSETITVKRMKKKQKGKTPVKEKEEERKISTMALKNC